MTARNRRPGASRPDTGTVEVCRRPIFIIGSPRSGTTALGWALAEHSALWTAGESDVLFLFRRADVRELFTRARARPFGWFSVENVERWEYLECLGLGINALFTSRSRNRRWIDQNPEYTMMVDLVAELFPDAQFIHLLRDGHLVVQSMINFLATRDEEHRRRLEEGNYLPPWVNDFREACIAWRRHVEAASQFSDRHPGRCITVTSAALVSDPAREFKRIFEFLKVGEEPAPADYLRSHRINSSFTRGASHPVGPDTWQDPWDSWTQDQKRIFVEEALGTVQSLGMLNADEVRRRAIDTYAEESIDRARVPEWVRTAQFREALDELVPLDANIAVITEGDDALLAVGARIAIHFSDLEGTYNGHPEDSEAAIALLERLRAKDTQFLVVPSESYWWFQHYWQFAAYLYSRFHATHHKNDGCIVFDVRACRDDI